LGVVVLIVLAAVWAAFLLPPVLRARSEHRPSGSISDFRRQLHVLSKSSPAGQLASPAYARVVPIRQGTAAPSSGNLRLGRSRSTVKRRRDIVVGLLAVMAGTLVLGVVPQLRILWTMHLGVDVLFAAYVAALVYLRNQAAEREMKVRFLPAHVGSEPALLLRRSVN